MPQVPLHNKNKLHELLDLLHLFVQIKEAAGIERASLSSLLALSKRNHQRNDDILSEKDHPSNTTSTTTVVHRLLSDLILQVENQRSLLQQLHQLPDNTNRKLVLELSQMSPKLVELQSVLLGGGAIEDTIHHYDAATIWNLITTYIDKLHALELLIVEELEWSVPEENEDTGNNEGKNLPSTLATTSTSTAVTERIQDDLSIIRLGDVLPSNEGSNLLATVQGMTPQALKQQILQALTTNASEAKNIDNDEQGHHAGMTSLKDSNSGSSSKASNNLLTTPLHHHHQDGPSTDDEWKISIYDIKFTKRIGQGASATTYVATWNQQQVAVKVAAITKFGLAGWKAEVAALQRLRHPNVILLLGSICHANPLTYCLVLEYCNAGDLATCLKYPTPKNFFFHVAKSICHAMAYLHSRNVIHRDLKPSNILCDGKIASGNFTVKVTDFGVATDAGRTALEDSVTATKAAAAGNNLTGETGTYRWMAPEVIRHESYSTMADVYSFAIILRQLITREEPFATVDATQAAAVTAMEQGRPPFPANMPTGIQELIQVNWNNDPSARQDFGKLSEHLLSLQDTMTAEENRFLQSAHGHPVYHPYMEKSTSRDSLDSFKSTSSHKRKPRKGRLSGLFGSSGKLK